MVSVSASLNLPLHHKVQKFSSGTGSPGWSQKNGHKTVVVWLLEIIWNQATGYASQHIWCLSLARINWEGCCWKGIWRKNGRNEGAGSLISPDGVAFSRIVGVSASDVSPCNIKSTRSFLLALADPDSPEKGRKTVVCEGMCCWRSLWLNCYCRMCIIFAACTNCIWFLI